MPEVRSGSQEDSHRERRPGGHQGQAGRATKGKSGAGGEPASEPVLRVHDVSVRFSDAIVLENVTFDLAAGCFLAVVGPNGGGKSTLIKVALGLVEPQTGYASLFGAAAGSSPERIGYVPQLKTFDRSFPATALELVVSGLRRSWPARIGRNEREAGVSALEHVGAGQLAGRPLARLSGGELQRVYLARALVREPELVLLDEPATGVDFIAEHDLHDLLEAYQEHMVAAGHSATVVMITHDMAAARYHADQVLVLNRRLMAFGPPDDVLADDELKAAFGHRHHDHAVAP